MTLSELHENCCKYLLIEKGDTQATIDTYKANFREFYLWLGREGLPLGISSISDYQILRRFMYHLAERKLHQNTVRLRMNSLKAFCKYLLYEGDIRGDDPFNRVRIPKKIKGLPQPVHDKNRDILLSRSKSRALSSGNERDIQMALIMELGFKAGLRRGAIRNLKFEKIDFENGYCYVIDKGQKEKCYPLAPSILQWLKRLKVSRGVFQGPVILSPRSKTAISETSLHDEFKRYVQLFGIDETKIHLHSMRHTYGTNLHNMGFNTRDIQVALGHDDIGSVQVYTEVPKKELREKIKRAFSKSK